MHAQRTAYGRYRALPPYPAAIRGRLDPESWAVSPNRRADLHDATTDVPRSSDVTGFPVPRVWSRVSRGTNIGWTPLFTRAAAAIVARELGDPAVVGCGNATTRIATGDVIQVDGARGTVKKAR